MRRARSSGCTAIAETFIATLPGYTDGPKDIRGRLEDAGEPLLLKQLVEGFAGWVLAYNAERPHRSLNGLTPQARFTGDPTPLVLVARPKTPGSLRPRRDLGRDRPAIGRRSPPRRGVGKNAVTSRQRPIGRSMRGRALDALATSTRPGQ